MEDGRAIGARDLILAVFRLAVADYLGVWYGHDEPAPVKRTKGGFHSEAEEFLRSSWGHIWPTSSASRPRPSGVIPSDCISPTGKWYGQRSCGHFLRQSGYLSLHSPSQLICKSLDFM